METSPKSTALLVVISAPSGGGKTTLCQKLIETEANLARVITCTTRAPREGEKDGADYFFFDADQFLKRVQAGHFLEHATVYGNSYGTLKSEVLGKLRSGRDVLLNIDVQGAAAIQAQAEHEEELKRALVTIFLTPESLSELERRLNKRGTDAPEVIRKRLGVARQELAQWKHFDYLILSRSIDEDLHRARAILEAERLRRTRAVPPSFE